LARSQARLGEQQPDNARRCLIAMRNDIRARSATPIEQKSGNINGNCMELRHGPSMPR